MSIRTATLYLFSRGLGAVIALVFLACASSLCADTITLAGTINQSIQDGTGPAINNPSLNLIQDASQYIIALEFTGSITAPGTYDLTGSTLVFAVASDRALEHHFDFVNLTVMQSGALDQVSIFGCLESGSGCNQGNELDLSFAILSADLNRQGVAAQGTPGLVPLDLLEDDGVTDIHGSIANYSYTSVDPVPEPLSAELLGICLIAAGLIGRKNRRPQK